MSVRLKLFLVLLALGLVGYLLTKPEVRRKLESTLGTGHGSRDGGPVGRAEDFSGDAGPAFVLAGSHLEVSLMSAPQTHYLGELAEDAGDLQFRELVTNLGGGSAQYDPWLSRAAREIAFQGALLSDSPPEAALSFILRSAGAPELSVAQVLVRANGDDPKVIRAAIERVLGNAPMGAGQLLLGIGEAATDDGPYDRRVVVVAARRNFELEATPRTIAAGATWRIRGRTQPGFHDAHASVLYPNLSVLEIPIDVRDGHFSLEVPAGDVPGALRVSIDGTAKAGPFKLLQLVAEVGGDAPRTFGLLVPEEESFVDLAAAEDHALRLLNEDRRRLDLPPLLLDPALSDVSRGHSEDMRDNDFFAHLSPRTGLAGERLSEAGYRSSAHGENLALNDSVFESQASLMESVGHRLNIINTSMTHVGIGLARGAGDSGGKSWYLTQLFARKVMSFDAAQAALEFTDRINYARAELGFPALEPDQDLTDLALEGCERGLEVPIEGLPSWLAPQASKQAKTTVAVSVHVFYNLAELTPDATSLSPKAKRLGLAFLRDEENLHGKTFSVLIAAE